MIVNYYLDIHDDTFWKLLAISVKSIHRNMPKTIIRLVHPDWFQPKAIDGIDKTFAVPNIKTHHYYAYRRFACNAELPVGDNLFLDVDTIVQRDVSDVFLASFDIALAVRDSSPAPGIIYNGGVVFCRNREIWKHMSLVGNNTLPEWQHSERALTTVARMNEYTLKELNSRVFNYTPGTKKDSVSHAAIVHYKGRRKDWMLLREKEFTHGIQ